MKCKLVCPDCGDIFTVYINLGGIIIGSGDGSFHNEDELHLLQTCEGENGENLSFLLTNENGSLMIDHPEYGKTCIATLSDIGECPDCSKKIPIKDFLK